MGHRIKLSDERKTSATPRYGLGGAIIAAVLLAASPVLAQGWWPWSSPEPERAPIPREPVYRAPPAAGPPPVDWSTRNPICLKLEQRLIQDGQRTSQSRNALPKLEADIRAADRTYQSSRADLDRRGCYEYFLFSKTLRRTRRCIDLARENEHAKRQMAELESQRQQIISSSERSYRDEIVAELARHKCGANYVQEARRQNRGPSPFWQDNDGGSYGGWNPFGATSYATYRTLCVRLCDGYYFPVSFSTLPSHFEQDAAKCQSKCTAPVELYYYQNPGQAVDQSIAFRTQEPYTNLKSAFRYRKELVQGCSCKEAEYVPQTVPPGDKRAQSAPSGWEARSEQEARSR